MEATLLYSDDCPNWQQTASHLDRLTSEFPELKVTRQLVDTDEAAQRLGFLGSPRSSSMVSTYSLPPTRRLDCRVGST